MYAIYLLHFKATSQLLFHSRRRITQHEHPLGIEVIGTALSLYTFLPKPPVNLQIRLLTNKATLSRVLNGRGLSER